MWKREGQVTPFPLPVSALANIRKEIEKGNEKAEKQIIYTSTLFISEN